MARRHTISDNPFARTTREVDPQSDMAPARQDDTTTERRVDTSPQRQGAETTPPIRMAFYLSPDLVNALEARYQENRATARAEGEPDMRRVSRSAIVEEALRAFLGEG